ncbi:hypothetical protein D9619_005413 [Psilocybe cf. subviscida]|uniref:Uncharacterized protein n=1 Tax=Psilocybe cf. subviscida TaxID=2480587 RepID=A0A8H5BYY3_9AGAR|nr:hypothetical protein D9619_005413 [Psilocybe cf. subviscida]
MPAECRRRLSQPTITHTRIASPFLETGSGRASPVADFGVVALAHYDPSSSEVVQRLAHTLNSLQAADACAVPPLPISLRGRHLHLDALTLGCIAGQLMRSGLDILVLPQSRTLVRAPVHVSVGSAIAPTLASSGDDVSQPSSGHRCQQPIACVNLCDQPQTGSIANLRGASAGAETGAA